MLFLIQSAVMAAGMDVDIELIPLSISSSGIPGIEVRNPDARIPGNPESGRPDSRGSGIRNPVVLESVILGHPPFNGLRH